MPPQGHLAMSGVTFGVPPWGGLCGSLVSGGHGYCSTSYNAQGRGRRMRSEEGGGRWRRIEITLIVTIWNMFKNLRSHN